MLNSTLINVTTTETLLIQQEADVIGLTKLIRQQAVEVGMNVLYQTKLITAASELTRNMLNYAGSGTSSVERVQQGTKEGIRLTFTDQGPGIPDIDQAMQDGYSSGTGLGVGLPGARRLMDEFTLTSALGEGTTITVILWSS